ncbi:hypothetical protein [Variovorax sp. RA8]|uniref:hypothetical protein n=1 Tax=Variovorax sp. (strain JCM 16519 / RA8) TaxID=662548 RepID=UPI000A7479CB|nr:hypothetical protein [Variovorax sp. RA8]VTU34604.1 hypothetical protein RA8CHR_05006 [Variovorax sp. RA8]
MNTDFDFFPKRKAQLKFKKQRARALKFLISDFLDRFQQRRFADVELMMILMSPMLVFTLQDAFKLKDDVTPNRMVQVLASEVAKAPSRIPHETLDAVMNDSEVKKAMAAAFLKQAEKPNKPILLETEQTP